MSSSGTLRRVALVRTDVSEELCAFENQPYPSTASWDLALYYGHSQTHALPSTPTPLCILISEFHTNFLSHLVFLCSARRLLGTASVVPISPILVALMKEALSSFETSVLTRATRRNIPEDDIFHSHCRENLKSYIALTGWTL
jgi:hypothetical protein